MIQEDPKRPKFQSPHISVELASNHRAQKEISNDVNTPQSGTVFESYAHLKFVSNNNFFFVGGP